MSQVVEKREESEEEEKKQAIAKRYAFFFVIHFWFRKNSACESFKKKCTMMDVSDLLKNSWCLSPWYIADEKPLQVILADLVS